MTSDEITTETQSNGDAREKETRSSSGHTGRLQTSKEVEPVQNEMSILAAEVDPADQTNLRECLIELGYQVQLASSAEEVLSLIRRFIFTKAVIGIELKMGDKPVLSRLSHLATIERLIAIGCPTDSEAERSSLLARAHLYLRRPVTTDSLAKALWPNPCGTYVSETKEKRRA